MAPHRGIILVCCIVPVFGVVAQWTGRSGLAVLRALSRRAAGILPGLLLVAVIILSFLLGRVVGKLDLGSRLAAQQGVVAK